LIINGGIMPFRGYRYDHYYYYTFRMFVWMSPTIVHLGSTHNQLTSIKQVSK